MEATEITSMSIDSASDPHKSILPLSILTKEHNIAIPVDFCDALIKVLLSCFATEGGYSLY
jgi:hypothetical protein